MKTTTGNNCFKAFMIIVSISVLMTFSSCSGPNKYDLHEIKGFGQIDTSVQPNILADADNVKPEKPYIANERDPHIKRDLVGDPMEAYFSSETYDTKTDPKSKKPIYSKDSFIKGTYPLDDDVLQCDTARVIIIQFKEDIDVNCIYNKEKPVISIIYGSHSKDVTNQYNFTYDSVTQKLLITSKGVGNCFGSGMEITINGDNLRTAEIEETNIKHADGTTEHIDGQKSRQLTGIYSFGFNINN